MSAAAQIREYFNNDEDLLNVRVFERGIRRSIFNDQEILHMRDVKGLVNGVRIVQFSTGFFLVAVLIVGFTVYRRQFTPVLAELASLSGLATLGLMLLVGLSSLIGFDRLFLAFHLVSFSNDLWQLDPNTDLLIAMFPQNFFFSATMIIASLSITQALILTIIRPLWLKTAPWRPIQRRQMLSSCRKV
jgi:integral membrane protein (TIGR01906 family)